MALHAHGGARLGRREVDEAESERRDAIAHQVVMGVGGTRPVTRLAADLDGDRAAGRRLAGAVTREAGARRLAGKSIPRECMA